MANNTKRYYFSFKLMTSLIKYVKNGGNIWAKKKKEERILLFNYYIKNTPRPADTLTTTKKDSNNLDIEIKRKKKE